MRGENLSRLPVYYVLHMQSIMNNFSQLSQTTSTESGSQEKPITQVPDT